MLVKVATGVFNMTAGVAGASAWMNGVLSSIRWGGNRQNQGYKPNITGDFTRILEEHQSLHVANEIMITSAVVSHRDDDKSPSTSIVFTLMLFRCDLRQYWFNKFSHHSVCISLSAVNFNGDELFTPHTHIREQWVGRKSKSRYSTIKIKCCFDVLCICTGLCVWCMLPFIELWWSHDTMLLFNNIYIYIYILCVVCICGSIVISAHQFVSQLFRWSPIIWCIRC